jgi:hypothetical protein
LAQSNLARLPEQGSEQSQKVNVSAFLVENLRHWCWTPSVTLQKPFFVRFMGCGLPDSLHTYIGPNSGQRICEKKNGTAIRRNISRP